MKKKIIAFTLFFIVHIFVTVAALNAETVYGVMRFDVDVSGPSRYMVEIKPKKSTIKYEDFVKNTGKELEIGETYNYKYVTNFVIEYETYTRLNDNKVLVKSYKKSTEKIVEEWQRRNSHSLATNCIIIGRMYHFTLEVIGE